MAMDPESLFGLGSGHLELQVLLLLPVFELAIGSQH